MAHTDNNIAFWDLDNDANDDSGNGWNLTNNGAVTFDGTKASFNGSNQWLDSASSLLNGLTNCSISLWASYVGYPGGSVVSEGLAGSNGSFFWEGDGFGSFGRLLFWGAGGNQDNFSTLPATGLHNYVIIRTPTTVQIYRDNSLIDNFSNSSVGNINDQNSGSSKFNIGRVASGSGGGTTYFNGTIQSVSVYSVVKDATWLTDEYNSGTPKKWADWTAFINAWWLQNKGMMGALAGV